jgi:putative hydrolase of HD superfamily
MDRLGAILDFIRLADRLKTVERRGCVGERRETTAEHSWHMALMALLLHREVALEADLGRTLAMVLVHDLVEIEAGDTFAYDIAGAAAQKEREEAAANRIFALPPPDLGAELRALWEEFEAGQSAEARLAQACDRVQGMLQNLLSDGRAWREGGVVRAQIERRMAPAEASDPVFATLVARLFDEADARRLLG